METGALTKSANQFGGFLSSLLDKEKDYIQYLREERQRAFFVTSHSLVGTVRKPYIGKDALQDYFIGSRGQYVRRKKRGTKVGRDGRTSRQRLADMRKRPGFAKRFSGTNPSLARNFGRANAVLNVATAGLEFSDRLAEGQSVAKAGIGTGASVAGGLAGAAKGAALGAFAGPVGILVGGLIGGAIGSFAAGTAADITTGLVGLNEGGVLTAPTRSLIAEGGQPEVMIPFDDIGKNITEMTYKPLGSLMVGAASGLLAVLPMSSSTAKLKVAINKSKRTFGIEQVKPAIKGSSNDIGVLKTGLEVTLGVGLAFVSSLFMAGPASAQVQNATVSSGMMIPAGDVTDRGNGQFGEGPLLRVAKQEGIEGKELAAFLAQMSHETGQFQFRRELSGGREYYGGHTGPWTDAKGKTYTTKYHGRGYIQLTHDYNYKKYGDMFGVDLLNNPDLAMDGDLAAKIAVAYWKSTVRPRVQRDGGDYDNVFSHSAAINLPAATSPSQINGYADRVAKYNAYKEQLLSGELKDKQDEATKVEEPDPNAKFSPAQVQELGKILDKIEENKIENLGLHQKVAGVGTIVQGKGWFGGAQVKFFDVNGREINRDKWYKTLYEKLPEGGFTPTENAEGGIIDTAMMVKSPTPKVDSDPEQLNIPAEKRDFIAMEKVEESIDFLPIMFPGQNVPVESIVEKVVTKKEPSYFDPFSHGVKRGKKVVL